METSKESTTINTLAKLVAGFLVVLFVLSTIVVLFSFFPIRQLLSPDFYKLTLEDEGVYHRLPGIIAERLATNIVEDTCVQNPGSTDCSQENALDNTPVYFMILTQQEWESILSELIDPDWLQTQTENILDQFFYILLNSPNPMDAPLELSLNEVKKRLAGPQGIQAFNQILDAQPDCSLDQLFGLLQLGLGMPTDIETLLCQPPDYIMSELNPVVESFLSGVVDQFPDQLTFYLPDEIMSSSTSGNNADPIQVAIPKPIQTLRRTYRAISISPIVPLVLLSLVTILTVRSLREFLLWWGVSLLTAGLISLVLALSLTPISSWAFPRLIPGGSEASLGLSNLLIELGVVDFSRVLAERLVMSIVIPAGVITIIGLTLLLALYLINRQSRTQKSLSTETTDPDS